MDENLPDFINDPNDSVESTLFKYVTFEDGTVLFTENYGYGSASHKDLVEFYKKVEPVSAGTIKVVGFNKKTWGFFGRGSMSSHLTSGEKDQQLIQKAIGKGIVYDPSIMPF